MTPNIDIFYVSYLHDLEWFQWSLNTVRKNLTGYRDIIVVASHDDAPLFQRVDPTLKVIPVTGWPGRGYFWQQYQKMRAWTHTDAEYICFMDSDTMVMSPTRIEDMFVDGLPCWMYQAYDTLPPDVPWRVPTEETLGIGEIRDEYMRAFPFIVHRETLVSTEDRIIKRHKYSLEYYTRMAGAFSEFNCLGAWAAYDHPERYCWFDTALGIWPDAFKHVRQFWSHSPLSELTDELAGYAGKPPILTDFGVWVIPGDTHLCKWIREHRRLDFDHALIEREILPEIAPGDKVIDIGAFVGDHTIAYARAVGPSGRVLAYEPNPEAFTCLYKNMQPLQNTVVLGAAIGGKSGRAELLGSPNVGASHLVENVDGSVFVSTLDDEVGPVSRRISLIKIDAEGFELAILGGAEQVIQRDHPTLVLEVNEGALKRQGASGRMLHEWLAAHGYGFRVISGILGELQYDILCKHRSAQ